MNTAERSVKRSRRRSNSFSSMTVLDAAWRQRARGLLLQFLPEPRHRSIEMVKVETFDTGNVVVRHPGRAVPIRPGNEKPVQSTDKHGALDRKLEGAMLQQFAKHIGDAEPFPDPTE